jgi:hypothetical protein
MSTCIVLSTLYCPYFSLVFPSQCSQRTKSKSYCVNRGLLGIVEQGTHEELLAMNGAYTGLVEQHKKGKAKELK